MNAGHTLGPVSGREGAVEQPPLEAQAFRERRLEGPVHRLFGHRDDGARQRRDLGRHLDRLVHQRSGGDDAAHQPRALGFGRVHRAPGQHHLHGLGFTDRAHQSLGAADAGKGAQADLGLAELGVLGGDDDVAHHRQLAAAAKRRARDRRHRRHAARGHAHPVATHQVIGDDIGE